MVSDIRRQLESRGGMAWRGAQGTFGGDENVLDPVLDSSHTGIHNY